MSQLSVEFPQLLSPVSSPSIVEGLHGPELQRAPRVLAWACSLRPPTSPYLKPRTGERQEVTLSLLPGKQSCSCMCPGLMQAEWERACTGTEVGQPCLSRMTPSGEVPAP